MKRHLLLLTIFISLALLVACGPTQVEPNTDESATAVAPTSSPADESSPVRPTVTSTGSDAYPVAPTPETQTEGYPEPESQPAQNPYPSVVSEEGKMWMVIAAGKQCEDVLTYPTEADAVKSLEDAGVTVYKSQTVEVGVIAVCGASTSTQYLALVDDDKTEDAEKLGWLFAE